MTREGSIYIIKISNLWFCDKVSNCIGEIEISSNNEYVPSIPDRDLSCWFVIYYSWISKKSDMQIVIYIFLCCSHFQLVSNFHIKL